MNSIWMLSPAEGFSGIVAVPYFSTQRQTADRYVARKQVFILTNSSTTGKEMIATLDNCYFSFIIQKLLFDNGGLREVLSAGQAVNEKSDQLLENGMA